MGYVFRRMLPPDTIEKPAPGLPEDVRQMLEEVIRLASKVLARYPESDDDL